MPELAEVEITRRKLLPLVRGRRILDFWTDWPRGLKLQKPNFVRRDIRGRKILDGHRTGKVIFLHLSGTPERMMAFHQRMSGRLEYAPRRVHSHIRANERMKNRPAKWVHSVFRFSDGSELRFVDPRKFGLVWYGSPQELNGDKYLGCLGRDARDIKFSGFSKIIRSGRGMIKPFLLRQDNFAGIGNIIADESLWLAKIHPRMNIAKLENPQTIMLYRAIQKTIASMLSSGGTTLRNWGHPDGKIGGYQEKRLIYGKAGEPCPRCHRKLKRIIVGGRGTTVCPKCQKL